MKNFLRSVFIFIAAVIPAVMMIIITVAVPAQYSKTFLGELTDKYTRQTDINEAKITVVGGSSVAFGLNSAMLEEYMGMPVVNFGLYASLGTKIMLDLSRKGIGKGDIVVIAPELDSQTLSLYFNAESMWQALDSDISMIGSVRKDELSDLAGGWFDYVGTKFRLWADSAAPDPQGVYNHSSFNEYGDIVYERSHNIMKLGYDPNKQIVLEPSIFSKDFIDYLNEYIEFAEKKGAVVYYSFPPMNETSLSASSNEEGIFEFYKFICENINCTVISNINDYILNENYFYDSNFHLNDSGVTLRTATLISDLRRAAGNAEKLLLEIPDAPERPAYTPDDGGEIDVWAEYFIFSEIVDANGALSGYNIIGVSDSGRDFVKLEFPKFYNGYQVLTVSNGALDGCGELTDISVRDNIISIENGAFSGAPMLRRVHIYNEDEMSMSVSPNGLFDGAPSDVTICFYTKTSYDAYIAGYYWANYGSMMKLIK